MHLCIYIYMFMHCCAAVLQLLRASARGVDKKKQYSLNVPHKVHMHTRTYIYMYAYVYVYIYICMLHVHRIPQPPCQTFTGLYAACSSGLLANAGRQRGQVLRKYGRRTWRPTIKTQNLYLIQRTNIGIQLCIYIYILYLALYVYIHAYLLIYDYMKVTWLEPSWKERNVHNHQAG